MRQFNVFYRISKFIRFLIAILPNKICASKRPFADAELIPFGFVTTIQFRFFLLLKYGLRRYSFLFEVRRFLCADREKRYSHSCHLVIYLIVKKRI